MFTKLEVLENTNTIYDYNSTKEELINEIERLLIENKNIMTILKNKDNSYSIYDNKNLEEAFVLDDPIITFKDNDDFKKVLKFIRLYIDNKILLDKTILKFEERIKKINKDNSNHVNSLINNNKDIHNLIYNDKEESKKLYNIIHEITSSKDYCDECADNFRFAKVGDKYQEYFYKQAEDSGCCGYYDRIIDVDGIQYKIGFNYGH